MPEIPVSSVYIHIPFCVRKCAYCDFLSFPSCGESGEKERTDYVGALLREIRLAPSWFAEEKGDVAGTGEGQPGFTAKVVPGPLRTIYFGGGTPSLLSPEQVGDILLALREVFGIEEDCEITLEANPGTVDEAKLRGFLDTGVNRLSLGIQSLDDSVLQTLGRIHDAKTAMRAIRDAKKAGFRNLSCDMMLGIPGQTKESVKATLDTFLSEEIPHVSLYSLILEEGTPMYERYGGDIEKYVSQEQDRELYHLVTSTLKEKGFLHYEISNMGRPGFESRHNMMYWRAGNYFAFGAGAHYYLGNERGRHVETVSGYIDAVTDPDVRKEDVCITEEILTEEDKRKEFMMLAFRTGSGVDEELFQAKFGMPVESAFGEEIKREIEAGLVVHDGASYHLTEKGADLGNQVFMDYV